jgi:serine/threonine protein kinase/WD40 repeat protein
MISHSTIPEADWLACEARIKQFEEAWSGESPPDIDDYLFSDHPFRRQLLAELLHIDLEFRWRAGEEVAVEEYLRRYEQEIDEATAVELIKTEFALRNRQMPLVLREYVERFPHYRDLLIEHLEGGVNHLQTTSPQRHTPREAGTILAVPTIPGCLIEQELGRGGMGVVYQARQPALNRLVAVKTLIASTPTMRGRFRREAEAMARLDHPRIVPIYEVGEWQNEAGESIPYFIMKWYAGGSVDSNLASFQTNPRASVQIVEKVARAVHHAHQRGILHRDLKPSNILLDEKNEPHVADLGLAGLIDASFPPCTNELSGGDHSLTRTQGIFGTPAYMAPEQARDPGSVTTAADVYGLGAVLYHLLTGRPPVDTKHLSTPLKELPFTNPTEPSRLNPTLSRDLEAICLKALEKDPSKRYSSADTLADDLKRWLEHRPIAARPTPFWKKSWQLTRRHPLLMGMAFATLTALIALIVILTLTNERIREKERETSDALARETSTNVRMANAFAREQRSLYLERVNSVGRLYEANQVAQAWQLLDECSEHLRDWEWSYFNALRRHRAHVLTGHQEWVGGVAFMADGRLASADNGGYIRVWDAKNRTQIKDWQASTKFVSQCIAHPSKPWLAVSDSRLIDIWDVDQGRKVHSLEGTRCVFSKDGTTIAVAQKGGISLWSTDSWHLIRELVLPEYRVIALAFAPDGRLAASTADGHLRIWDKDSSRELNHWKRPRPILQLVFNSDGKRLIEGYASTIVYSNPENEELPGEIAASISLRGILAATADPDRLVFVGASGEVIVWDIARRQAVRTYRGHSAGVSALAVSPDGEWLASAGGDRSIQLWDLQQETEPGVALTQVDDHAGTLAVSSDGQRIAIGTRMMGPVLDHPVRLLDEKAVELQQIAGTGETTFSSDSKLMANFGPDGRIIVRDAVTGKEVWSKPVPEEVREARANYAAGGRLSFSPDGRWLATWNAGATYVCRWKAQDGTPQKSITIGDTFVYGLAFDDQSLTLALATTDHIGVVDLASGEQRHYPFSARAIAYVPRLPQLIVAGRDRSIGSLDLCSGDVRKFIGTPTGADTIAFNAKGSRIVTGAADGSLRIWDYESGRELLTLRSRGDAIRALVWCPANDGIYALTGSLIHWRVK